MLEASIALFLFLMVMVHVWILSRRGTPAEEAHEEKMILQRLKWEQENRAARSEKNEGA